MEIFENGDSSYSRGRAKTEVFKYDDVMPGFKLALPHIRFENVMCGRRFFKYEKKSLCFRKYPATCGWSNTIQKRYVWTQIFLNTGEKISILENTRPRVGEALTDPCLLK